MRHPSIPVVKQAPNRIQASLLADVPVFSQDRENIFRILASVLHMSRIEFKSPSALEPAAINGTVAEDAIATVCTLLQLDPQELAVALLERVNYTRGEKVSACGNTL